MRSTYGAVLCGLFPISQTREPYSAIKFLAERVRIEEIYNLKVNALPHPACSRGLSSLFLWFTLAHRVAIVAHRVVYPRSSCGLSSLIVLSSAVMCVRSLILL